MKIFLVLASIFAIASLVYIFYSPTKNIEEIPLIPVQNTLAKGRILTIGSIAVEDVQDEINDFLPFAEFLASRLKDLGITAGKVKVAQTISEMAELLEHGEVDLYIDSPFPALTMVKLGVAKPALRRWKKGVASYHTVIFTHSNNNIATLNDFKGKVIAFDSPSSTSGYLIPKALLLQEGYSLIELRDATQEIKSDEVGYIFSEDDVNTMTWVLEGKVHLGATDNHHYYKEAGGRIGELEILAQSPKVPRHLVVYSNKLDEDFASTIKEVLMLLDKDEAGKAILYEFQKTAKFDEIPSNVERILELMQLVEGEL